MPINFRYFFILFHRIPSRWTHHPCVNLFLITNVRTENSINKYRVFRRVNKTLGFSKKKKTIYFIYLLLSSTWLYFVRLHDVLIKVTLRCTASANANSVSSGNEIEIRRRESKGRVLDKVVKVLVCQIRSAPTRREVRQAP